MEFFSSLTKEWVLREFGVTCGQAGEGLSVSLEREEWRIGRKMKVPYLSTSLV